MIMNIFMVLWYLFQAVVGTIVVVVISYAVWSWVIADWWQYRKARKEILTYVKTYKSRCTQVNRFVVTVPELQNIFREYDTSVIERVWQDLVKLHIISQDPMDNEWCIR